MKLFEQLPLFRLPPAAPVVKARHIQIGARIVPYELRQGPGRRLAMTIDEHGLRIGVPPRLTLSEVEAFVRSHADWVLEKLDEYAARATHRHLRIADGARLPVLGADVAIRVVSGANRVLWQDDALVLAARPDADLDALARRGLQRRALEHFSIRLGHYAGIMERPAPPLGLSSARGRWGSCSTQSGIRINWRLVHLPPEFADYVIAHEMAHLVEMNHSKRFWRVVGGLYPDWRETRAELKRRAAEIPIL
ncbi:MAG TPA: SprT family zinc-dependent metalloprotease [Rhodocyclaceae bacterium]|nr:SprT family zinc-dependent metalloprotease [Rhodocyclaceae bacterium]